MSKLIDAMGLVNELHRKEGITQRGGKKYTQVVHRMEAFRMTFGLDLGVNSQIVTDDGHRVVVKAIITDAEGRTVGSGFAEEIRGQGNVNKTSALENCETSAIGRALASIGLAGGEYASANELDAVPRKAAALEQNQAETPSERPPITEVAGKPSAPPEASPDPTDPDKEFFVELAKKLQHMKALGQVHNLFAEVKPRIKELKQRNPERAQHVVDLFAKYENKLRG